MDIKAPAASPHAHLIKFSFTHSPLLPQPRQFKWNRKEYPNNLLWLMAVVLELLLCPVGASLNKYSRTAMG